MTPAGFVLGLHLLSLHPSGDQRAVTPGVFVQAAAEHCSPVAGALRNSEGRVSLYAGCTWQLGPLDLTTGAITGYRRRDVLPLLVPSVRLGAVRFSVVPNPFGPWAIHLSAERRFN